MYKNIGFVQRSENGNFNFLNFGRTGEGGPHITIFYFNKKQGATILTYGGTKYGKFRMGTGRVGYCTHC